MAANLRVVELNREIWTSFQQGRRPICEASTARELPSGFTLPGHGAPVRMK